MLLALAAFILSPVRKFEADWLLFMLTYKFVTSFVSGLWDMYVYRLEPTRT